MSNILDSLVNVQISISSVAQSAESFSTVLIIGKAPSISVSNIKDVDVYSSLDEITAKGWTTDSNIYKAAKVAFMQDPKPDNIYIGIRKETDGVLEDIEECVARAVNTSGWYGLAVADGEESEYSAIASYIETTEKIFAFTVNTMENPLNTTEYLRTFAIYSEVNGDPTQTPVNNQYIHIAWMIKCFNFEPGEATWAYKILSGITASELTTSDIKQLEKNGINYYIACANKNITLTGQMVSGEWIDVIRFRDWLKNELQMAIFNLFIKNPKIPYTNGGINLVENAINEVLKSGQEQGGIAPDDFDDEENEIPGYVITVPNANSLTEVQRASRVLEDCKFEARLAGAIHVVKIKGNLSS